MSASSHNTADGTSVLVGDVAYEDVSLVAGAITPLPRGVGPMKIACLLPNTATSAYRYAGISVAEWMVADVSHECLSAF